MNTNEAAAALGIPPKELRKRIRNSLDYFGLKQVDGRWVFSKSDIARLRGQFENSGKVKKNSKNSKNAVEELTEEQKRILSRRDPKLNRQVTERHIQRVDRLEARLRAAGVHLSQHRDE